MKRKKSQNRLFIELCRATGELETLKKFKRKEYSNREKGLIIASMLEKLKPNRKQLTKGNDERRKLNCIISYCNLRINWDIRSYTACTDSSVAVA